MTIKQTFTAAVLASLCSLVLLPSTAVAHHGVTGQFDLEQILTVTGVVNRVRFVNPHSYVYFKVTNDAGKEEQWRCELRSGSLLKRKGWSTDMFSIGSTITIFGSPDRRDPKTVYTETITFEDGSVIARYDALDDSGNIAVGERELTREDGTPNLAGNWSEAVRDSPPPQGPRPRSDGPPEGVDLARDGSPQRVAMPGPTGRPGGAGGKGQKGGGGNRPRPASYVLTQTAQDEAGNFTADQNPRFNCEPTNIIFDYAFDQMMNKIEQTGAAIVLTYGFMDVVRTIHLIGDFPDEIEPSVAGYSVGKWEGDTLVVHTKGFQPGFLQAPGGRARGAVRHGDQMEITERFTMSEDGNELTREYSVIDPVYLGETYSGSNSSLYTTDRFIAYECEELKDDRQQ
jgi:hypothetical protein